MRLPHHLACKNTHSCANNNNGAPEISIRSAVVYPSATFRQRNRSGIQYLINEVTSASAGRFARPFNAVSSIMKFT